MGLFDHLFKTKSPPGEEKVVEHAPEGSGSAKASDAAARTVTPQRADPSAFLHPKSYVPRGAPSVTPAPRSGVSSGGKPPERRMASGGPPPAADEIVLTLGDVLSRIPTHYLTPGTHDAKRELRFKINDLSSDIARGRAAVPLSRIAQLVPDIFVKEIGREEDTEVRLPLQKLVEQIGLLRSQSKAPVVEKGPRPASPAELAPAARPIVDVEARKEVLREVVAAGVPPPMAGQALRPPIVLGEMTPAQRAVELKPSAAHAAPVILGPSPAAEQPVVVSEPVTPQPAAPAPSAVAIPVVVQPQPLPEIAKPASESAPLVSAVPPVAPAPAPAPAAMAIEPARMVFDWAAGAAARVEPPSESSVSKTVAEPVPAIIPEKLAESVPEVVSEKIAGSVVASAPEKAAEPMVASIPEKVVESVISSALEKPEEPVIASVPETAEEPMIASAPEKAMEPVIADAPEKAVEPVTASAPEKAVEPAVAAPKLAPLESPQLEPGEEKIQLSLAAILRHCPQEIIVGQLPHVDDSVRITLPFAPIDRQLIKGQVEVSSLRFVVALPEVYQKYFVAKVGVKVPIPLEEVFQNLPSPVHELTPATPPPLPYVLAPAPAAEVAPAASEPAEKLAAPPVLPVPVAPEAAEPKHEAEAVPEARSAEGLKVETHSAPVPAGELHPSAAAAPILETVSALSAFTSVRPSIKVGEAPSAKETSVSGSEASAAPASTVPPPLPQATATDALPASEEPAEVSPVPDPGPAFASDNSAGTADPAAAAAEVPKLVLQPPSFRPFFVPPPPIFGFAPPPTAPAEPEAPARVEPPSLLPSLTEAVPQAIPSEESAAIAPSGESAAVAGAAATVSAGAPPLPTPAAEAAVPAGSEPPPTPEMMALAAEESAPEMLVPFSLQPTPFADLAETLAHETTYASDLAEVVHVELPGAGADEPATPATVDAKVEEMKSTSESAEESAVTAAVEAPVAEASVAEAPTAETLVVEPSVPLAEHPSAPPVGEVVAAAAVTATVIEALPHPEHELAPKTEPAVETAASAKPPEETEQKSGLPAVDEAPPAAAEAPTSPRSQPPAAPAEWVLPPPPHPLFPVPKLPSEPAHVEVLPPPSLPLRRFDQDAVQALFMTEETLDLPKISRLAASLPGVYACVIATRDQACTGGNLPEGFDLAALLGLAPRVGEAAGRMPIGQLKHFTLYGEAYSVSFFERNGLSICAVHRPRSFVPGVREKLVALADELSR